MARDRRGVAELLGLTAKPVRPSAEYIALTDCCPNCIKPPWACECRDEEDQR